MAVDASELVVLLTVGFGWVLGSVTVLVFKLDLELLLLGGAEDKFDVTGEIFLGFNFPDCAVCIASLISSVVWV